MFILLNMEETKPQKWSNADKNLLGAYRQNNAILQDKVNVKNAMIREMKESINKLELELNKTQEKELYWKVKFEKKTSWW